MNLATALRVALILSTMLGTGGVRAVGFDQDAVSQQGGRPDVRVLIDEGRYDKAEAAAREQPAHVGVRRRRAPTCLSKRCGGTARRAQRL